MSLRERFYSILIVSATDSFTSAFADLLPETRYYPIHNVTSVSAAKRALAEKHLILLSSTPLCLMMWVLVLQLTPVLPNRPLCCFW